MPALLARLDRRVPPVAGAVLALLVAVVLGGGVIAAAAVDRPPASSEEVSGRGAAPTPRPTGRSGQPVTAESLTLPLDQADTRFALADSSELTLDDAVSIDAALGRATAVRRLLTTLGYEGGFVRKYSSSSGLAQAQLVTYRFGSPADAARFVAATVPATGAVDLKVRRPYDLFTACVVVPTQGQRYEYGRFADGPYVASLVLSRQGSSCSAPYDDLETLIDRQHDWMTAHLAG